MRSTSICAGSESHSTGATTSLHRSRASVSGEQWPIACAICQACDAPAVACVRYGKGKAVLCAYHRDLLGKFPSFAAAFRARKKGKVA